jgi:hypothetical protein
MIVRLDAKVHVSLCRGHHHAGTIVFVHGAYLHVQPAKEGTHKVYPVCERLCDPIDMAVGLLDHADHNMLARKLDCVGKLCGALATYIETTCTTINVKLLAPMLPDAAFLPPGVAGLQRVPDRHMYTAMLNDLPVMIKFTQSYGVEAHRYAAEAGYAPSLINHSKFGGESCSTV